jgi:predicted negative regulator of RcsB-dependent stress response
VSEQDDTKQSRRARRRAERAEAEQRGPDEGVADGTDAPQAEAEAPAEPAPNRAQRRAAKRQPVAEPAETTDAVRDRNQRARDKAIARRREKREREAAVARGLDASEMVDDALARATHGITQFVRKHSSILQWLIVLGIAGGFGWQIWSWRHGKTVAKASDALMSAVSSEQGRVGDVAGKDAPDPRTGMVDPTPIFESDEVRLRAAAERYEQASELRKGSGTAILARLGVAGVLFEQGKYDEAIAAYEEVKSSGLGKHDPDVRLRAVESIGLAREAKQELDLALKSFRELENSEVIGFKPLGLLHQARVHFAKGEKDKAKELAKAAQEAINKERSPYQTSGYLDNASRELLAAIDPSSVPPTPGVGYSQQQLDSLREQILKDPTKLQKMLEEMGQGVPAIPEIPMLPGGEELPGELEPDPGGEAP